VSQGFTLAAGLTLAVIAYVAPVRDIQSYGYEVSFWAYAGILAAGAAAILVPAKQRTAEEMLLE